MKSNSKQIQPKLYDVKLPFMKFGHEYIKLKGQKQARLIYMSTINSDELNQDFIEYDLAYFNKSLKICHNPIPPTDTKVIFLVFLGNNNIPFTSIRPWFPENEIFYKSRLGKTLSIFCVHSI